LHFGLIGALSRTSFIVRARLWARCVLLLALSLGCGESVSPQDAAAVDAALLADAPADAVPGERDAPAVLDASMDGGPDATAECLTCAEMYVQCVPPVTPGCNGGLLICQGSSHALLTLTQCFCGACEGSCQSTCAGTGSDSAECATCYQQAIGTGGACEAAYAGCIAH
jgi:hypothetical protein